MRTVARQAMAKILVTGAFGQIGTELTRALRTKYGPTRRCSRRAGAFARPTVEEPHAVLGRDRSPRDRSESSTSTTSRWSITWPALLSVVSESDPQRAWSVNVLGLYNMLESAREHGVRQIFWPSSIAAFGPETDREQDTPRTP